jgi:hypothetical protein
LARAGGTAIVPQDKKSAGGPQGHVTSFGGIFAGSQQNKIPGKIQAPLTKEEINKER